MFARRPILLNLAAVLCFAECIEVPLELYGDIEVAAYDLIGGQQPVQAELIDSRTLARLRSAERGRIDRVPYGEYKLRVWARGFYSVDADLRVRQPSLKMRVQLPLSAIECRTYSNLIGTLGPVADGHDLWVKVIPSRGSGGVEVPVQRYGRFLSPGLDPGPYLLVVMDGGTPIHSEGISLTLEETAVKINLKPASK